MNTTCTCTPAVLSAGMSAIATGRVAVTSAADTKRKRFLGYGISMSESATGSGRAIDTASTAAGQGYGCRTT